MQVVDMDGILGNIVTEVVRRSVSHARFDTAARHPDRKAPWMVIASVVRLGKLSLAVDCTSEFPAPNNQSVVKKSALLQILNQCG